MADDRITRAEQIALIEAHAWNTLRHSPEDVTSRDRLFLISEIRRLESVAAAARIQADCYGAYPGLLAAIKELDDT